MTHIVKREGQYWIIDCPIGIPDMGPYRYLNRPDNPDDSARNALEGLERFILFDYCDMMKPGPKVKTRRLT